MATHSSVLSWRIPGMGSLVGCRLWGHTESDTTEATQQQQQQHTLPKHPWRRTAPFPGWFKGAFFFFFLRFVRRLRTPVATDFARIHSRALNSAVMNRPTPPGRLQPFLSSRLLKCQSNFPQERGQTSCEKDLSFQKSLGKKWLQEVPHLQPRVQRQQLQWRREHCGSPGKEASSPQSHDTEGPWQW